MFLSKKACICKGSVRSIYSLRESIGVCAGLWFMSLLLHGLRADLWKAGYGRGSVDSEGNESQILMLGLFN